MVKGSVIIIIVAAAVVVCTATDLECNHSNYLSSDVMITYLD